jgi:hypothetical protein
LFDVHAVVAAAEQMFPVTATGCRSMAAQADRIFAVAHARRSGRRALSPFRDITLDALRLPHARSASRSARPKSG